MAEIRISEIEDVTRAALLAHGASHIVADTMADAVRWAEARSNRICGLYYLESYCQQLGSGRVNGTVTPEVNKVRPAVIEVDAGYGFAQPAFRDALGNAVQGAQSCGLASLLVRHAHTCTALGWFTEAIARKGLIGLGVTNASPIVAPPGGKTRVLGTNPMSFAVPDGAGGVAMIFDQSTTTVALGRITMAKAAGEPIPEGWAVDAEGRPTTDPDAALTGSLCSVGGYKGWGLGLMVEVLAAGLAGGTASRDVKPLKAPEGDPHDLGHSFFLIDPGIRPDFHDMVSGLAEAVSQDDGARLPGQGKELLDTVEVPDALWQATLALAGR
ncbi:Ldh family oxidoreductase [Marivita hallyeonensis]|uniref:(2R)-3-sulfolactate dehydrogenase (NADP+) n=1 Tax=Marivita hallyeonensis TaxID=996342 RepID=A0A1M5NYX7_9RHOB|nr:Ldh family oxidoreductase [Marivita hallyeonensis]SHG94698.1 (2R)-3-sulfolactate dehydrogenase (NADP+) [Marivita hallyeonensis]